MARNDRTMFFENMVLTIINSYVIYSVCREIVLLSQTFFGVHVICLYTYNTLHVGTVLWYT